MKKILKISLISILTATVAMSCSKNDGSVYVGDDYINFTKSSKSDSTMFTFAYDSKLEKGRVGLEVEIASKLSPEDRKYKIKFVESESSAKEGYHFEKLSEYISFGANLSKDTLFINTIKQPDLSEKDVVAVFEIEESGNFKPGIRDNVKARVFITNKLSRPTWWNEWHESSGLGIYSDKKYRLFIEQTKEHDLDYEKREDMDYSKMRSLVLSFKYYVQQNNIMEDNGNPMKIAMRG